MATGTGPTLGRRRPVTAGLVESAVQVGSGSVGSGLPLLVRPVQPGVDLVRYAVAHADTVRSWLHRAGALLFRGFGVTLDALGPVLTALAGPPEPYLERSSPRTELADRIYTATDHPADQHIPLHNENSYQQRFPTVLAFCCQIAPGAGGCTPLADTRRVLARIPPEVREPFAEHGVLYVRNFGGGLGLTWQEVFQTSSAAAVADYCRARGIEVEWRPDGGLRTRQVRPAIAVHPATGERVWFNHATFFHPYALAPDLRDALLGQFTADDLPNNACLGDGRRIPDDVVAVLAEAYRAEEVAVPWHVGDLLLVDNLLAAHGRQAYSGERRIAVSMAAPVYWHEVDARRVGTA